MIPFIYLELSIKIPQLARQIKKLAGVTYDSCCWAMRLAHFKEKSGGGYDYGTGFELVLKGIGTTATNLGKRIKGNIPYYNANLGE